jgi:hypothetical protein
MKAVICQRHVRLAGGAQWEGKAIHNQPGKPLKGKEIPEFIVFPDLNLGKNCFCMKKSSKCPLESAPIGCVRLDIVQCG